MLIPHYYISFALVSWFTSHIATNMFHRSELQSRPVLKSNTTCAINRSGTAYVFRNI